MSNSSNGMITYIWGPALWHALHTISFNYPVEPNYENKRDYKQFFMSLANVLPCKYCRDNYKKNIKSEPTILNNAVFLNRESLSRWLYNLHNRINVNLGKPIYKTYEYVQKKFEQFRAGCGSKPSQLVDSPKATEKGCVFAKKSNNYKPRCVVTIVPRESLKEGFLNLYKYFSNSIMNGGGSKRKLRRNKSTKSSKSKKKRNKSSKRLNKSKRRTLSSKK